MPELQPIRTGASGRSRPSRAQSLRSQSSWPTANLHRFLSGQHLDDVSVYHHEHDHQSDDNDEENTYSTDSLEEATEKEDDTDAREAGVEEVPEVREGIPDTKDLEAGRPPLEKKKTNRSIKDPNLVTWDGPDDPANPKNWDKKHKWAATLVVSSFTFISPVSSSMVAPALTAIAKEFHITSEVESQLTLSIFVLAYAIGPLFLGPLSEIYGRVPVLQLSNLFYLVFNIACGASRSKGQMIAFRFLSGLGGSAPLALGGGVLSDCWRAEERGRSISIYSLAPLLGPAVGPIAGGFITENTTWRWAFWATSIADGMIQISGLFFLRETYAPKLLHQKAEKLRKETGNTALHTEYEHPERSLANVLKHSLVRPFRLLGTQIIVQVLAVYMAYLYGLMYLVLSTFPMLWETRYHESVGIGGLNYISLGVGFFLATQISAPINDRVYKKLKKRNNGVGQPEFRVPLMVPGSMFVPIGLFLYGWSAQYHTHWIVPNIGAAIFGAGVIMGFQCIQTYLVDTYTRFAASAIGAATVLRSLAGFGFPLFAPYMYAALDYGWGNSLLGFIAVGLGMPAPILLWKYGRTLRDRSTFAAGGGS
ncbi:MAG: MFS multidrug transporter [Lasallia pustulata]|uniref:MFS multidrug transporter n=1 Tax=Lasallia pustulata TaxID=136370 RepID=A0A5M8PHA5_9LECA|nr:MAG: MFS multidrug transporter [Lasallia pustulata]